MKDVNFAVQGDREVPRQGRSEQGEDRRNTTTAQCETPHRESCSLFRSIQESMQLCQARASTWYGHQQETISTNSDSTKAAFENKAAEVQIRISGSPRLKCCTSSKRSSLRSPFLQKEVDTQNMSMVVTVLTTGSMRQFLKCGRRSSSSRQHSMLDNLLKVKRICIGVDSGTADSKQERFDEISNMSIKNCWKKDFAEKNTLKPQPAVAVGATKCSQNSATRRAEVQVSSHTNHHKGLALLLDTLGIKAHRWVPARTPMPAGGGRGWPTTRSTAQQTRTAKQTCTTVLKKKNTVPC